jgi:hypothetical protein
MEPYPHHYSRRSRAEEPPVDPTLGFVLDELLKMETYLRDHMKQRCSELERRVVESEQRADERFISLEMARAELESGRADMEKSFEGLKLEVHRLNRSVECESPANNHGKPRIFVAELVSPSSPTGAAADGPDGHHVEHSSRDHEFGSAHAHPHVPANATTQSRPPPRALDLSLDSGRPRQFASSAESSRLPKLQFPIFNDEDPQLWCSRCENYFDMYGVESHLWVRVVSMYFESTTARWLQSAERHLKSAGWNEFCAMIHDRFGCDQHEALIRQLFHIKQAGSVSEYVEQFSALVDHRMSQITTHYITLCVLWMGCVMIYVLWL